MERSIVTGLHPEVLHENQRAVLERIASSCTELGFYLGGGTAIAIHLGHHRSVDFHWFTFAEDLDSGDLAAELRDRGIRLETTGIGKSSLHGTVDGVRVTFLRYRYPLLDDLVWWPELRCRLASLEDLVCMKLTAAAQRGKKRDFFDVVAICSSRIELADALELYKKKYAMDDIGHVLKSLCYFDDAEGDPNPDLIAELTFGEVKDTLRGWVKQYVG